MLQNITGSALPKSGSLSLVFALGLIIMLAGCDRPGSVGSGLTDSGAEVETRSDTIEVVSTRSFNAFSGNYSRFSAGGFNDPIFGDVTTTGFIKPALPSASDTLTQDATVKMRLLFDNADVLGDTLGQQTFDVYEVNEFWRPNAVKLNGDLAIDNNSRVATFTVGEEDSLEVTLDPQWVDDNYRPYVDSDSTTTDSLYKNQEFGLALVPTNSTKVIPFDVSSTRFVIENPDADTATVSSSQWAYQMKRSNQPEPPQGTAVVHNMLEQALKFSFDVSGIDLSGPDISRAELIFYQDEGALSQSVSASQNRPLSENVQLHYVDSTQTPDNLLPGSPIATGSFSEEDNAYHFNVTQFIQSGLINDLPEGQSFYMTLPNDGTVKSSLIYIDPESVSPPELVITYLKNTSN